MKAASLLPREHDQRCLDGIVLPPPRTSTADGVLPPPQSAMEEHVVGGALVASNGENASSPVSRLALAAKWYGGAPQPRPDARALAGKSAAQRRVVGRGNGNAGGKPSPQVVLREPWNCS
ncbi:hypothetical protein ZWY2020_041487 [Hordeum vulgare]|nr:hypothetical protein ZWY2020_041487 [Hordeum vulgare]